MKTFPKAKLENTVVQHLKDETLIYNLTTNQTFCLNKTSAKVFNACDGKTTFDDLKRQYQFTDDLIHFALAELKNNNLITNYQNTRFEGLSRREVIKRVGLTSMVALPIISSLIAPKAANAQSFTNLALDRTCTASAQCSSSAPNCAGRFPSMGSKRCCAGSLSYYDTGGVVNSCSGGNCSSATFACQPNANDFCCSNLATASCSGNSCACQCN